VDLPALLANESLLGAYWNQPGQIEGAILFSDRRVCFRKASGWKCTEYSAIRDVRILGNKQSASAIRISAGTGDLEVDVWGGGERSRDAFEVLRFLDRVREDLSAPPTR
jgi:hypothetical protein